MIDAQVPISYNEPSLVSDCGWPLDDGKIKRLLRGQSDVYRINGIHYPGPLRGLSLLAETMGTGVIYMYTSPSGKKYIGQTWDEYGRHWQHGNGRSRTAIFKLAIEKYGFESMIYEILHSGISNQSDLDKLELIEIENNNSMQPNGYNVKSGGSHGKHSIESRMKMSKSVKASQTPELLSILRDKTINNWKNPTIKKKMTDGMKGIKFKYKDGKRPISNSNKMKSRPVKCVETGIIYCSLAEAARAVSGSPGNISSRCSLGLKYTYRGFHWQFV